MTNLFMRLLPFLIVFSAALALTLVLTPIVREVNRRLGMVDKPDPRRINKVPIPRGGGVALFLGLFGSFLVYVFATGSRWVGSGVGTHPVRVTALAGVIFLLGLADDKWSLPPKLKLLGQIVVAFATWFWGGLGFSTLWPALPAAVDCILTVFWIVGAVNAFNLIDGLDGLASGIALIATLGMAGSLLFVGKPDQTLFHFAFAGALIGFLRYNYNPASVFLGDSGSMLIGYLVATLPLATQTPNSFLVSVGVPMLAADLRHLARDPAPLDTPRHTEAGEARGVRRRQRPSYVRRPRPSSPPHSSLDRAQPAQDGVDTLHDDARSGAVRTRRDDAKVALGRTMARGFRRRMRRGFPRHGARRALRRGATSRLVRARQGDGVPQTLGKAVNSVPCRV